MTKKANVKNTLQIHSQAKVEFYAEYLNRYLRILSLSEHTKQINIYDVFCGMGIYEDGGKGSPIVAFDTIKMFITDKKNLINNTQISLIVNDKEQQKIKRVKNYIDLNNQHFCNVRYYNEDVEQMFNVVQQEVSQTNADTRNLIFIDPYGYKDIKKEILYQLMENGKTEIILFLPISHMHRFTQKAIQSEERVQYEPLRNFVNSFFSKNHKIRKEQLPIMEYIQFITDVLKFNNKFFSTSYYITRDVANYFALFFMSSHIFWFQKILEVKWDLDEVAGRGFKIPEQMKSLFEAEETEDAKNKNANQLEEILLHSLITPKTNRQILELTLKSEFLPKHTTEIFEKWQKSNQKFRVYDLKTNKEARKNSFYVSEKEDKVQFKIEKQ
ncbi:MAG: three-Cys-motif partner protein TcmP [Prevotellaceae bacterium]|jgi:three-Cys-motif partner protein|nr:three-Cys-motif partner protein TcmP [Prevotellaceae bacterium]